MKLKITVDQKTYEVDVEASEPEAPTAARGYAAEFAPVRVPAAPAAPAKPVETENVNEGKVCRSPVSGIVVRAVTQPGQALPEKETVRPGRCAGEGEHWFQPGAYRLVLPGELGG